jgi:ATP-binding cassette subfamily B protein
MFFNFGRFVAELQSALAGSSRVFDLLNQPLEKQAIVLNGNTNMENSSMIALNNVNFSYEDKNHLLYNFNMVVPKGKVVALVGSSGAGKSTIIKLLMGFYPINSGDIIMDDKSINQYTLKELRGLIAYVPQDAYLFNGTIEENIRYGRVNASKEEIIEAAKKANAHKFIMNLPKGYDTNVVESGANLSGGQKQCISIARAFVKNAPILLLDEATSALDSESEQLVQKGLDALFQGRTALIIAHRLSTIKNANTIYVIENGKVSEVGTHDELMDKSRMYKRLYNIQFA